MTCFKAFIIQALPFLSFLPACILALGVLRFVTNETVLKACVFFYFPALSFGALAKTFWGSIGWTITVLVVGLVWNAFIFHALRQVGKVLDVADFDWHGFRCGMMIGIIPGALLGWRFWIRYHSVLSFLVCFLIGWLFTGAALGIYMGRAWCRYKD